MINRKRNYKRINDAVEAVELYADKLKSKKIIVDGSTPIENLIDLRSRVENLKMSCEGTLHAIDLTTKDIPIYE